MWVDHLEVTVQGHDGHECNAGGSVDRQHVEVNAAPGWSKRPVIPSPVGIDAEGHADEEQEVGQEQVKEENHVGFPHLHAATENPQGQDTSWNPHKGLDHQENLQEDISCSVLRILASFTSIHIHLG